ncbi:zinc ABC transporter substrate-binding protein [Thiomicrorhabdus immobilis]|uniref:High-affinity zinc uptake system protein ZnuA n=1 Tax=Thiomicrorhabdus immobilis TaxID=2791037 RepID=A0ABM7MEJ6_9GAMM|nr:zinc ABC transporter substrate-binding protein [Thiomicrorhabdus immobilis]BCN93859.1 zinc ABC transporter substrate-binding protein [Thiomicrorhabdus immobilis]
MWNILSSLIHKVRKEFNLAISRLPSVRLANAGYVFLSFSIMSYAASSYAVTITVSIPPLAGMIAPLLGDEDRVEVILKPGASPHGFQLKPSHLRNLQNSDLIVWVGSPVDSWMQKPLANLHTAELNLKHLPGIEEYPVRQGGLWETKHEHTHAEVHAEEKGEEKGEERDHHVDEHPHEQRMDGHLWMSFKNTLLLIESVSKQLQQMQPDHAQLIQQRTQAWLNQLRQSNEVVQNQLQAVKNEPFMVLHDAYQYFEKQYQLNGVGSIQLNPSVSPSLKRVAELRARIKEGGVKCVFKEPQFPERRVLAVVKGLDVKVGSLDPMGVVSKAFQQKQQQDFMFYDQFMLKLSEGFTACLQVEN